METLHQKKVRIRLKAYNSELLNNSCNQILNTIRYNNALAIGPIHLPTRKKIYCILRSPHVDKDSREHFEIRTHNRIIDVYQPSSKTIDSLIKLNLPSGVNIKVNVI